MSSNDLIRCFSDQNFNTEETCPFICKAILGAVHMRSEPARLGGISLDFSGIPLRWEDNFPYEREQKG